MNRTLTDKVGDVWNRGVVAKRVLDAAFAHGQGDPSRALLAQAWRAMDELQNAV